MTELWNAYASSLPESARELLRVLLPLLQIMGIVIAAVLLQKLLRRLVMRASLRYSLPVEFRLGARRLLAGLIYGGATLMVLERLGVSAAVLWSAFTGFVAVGAVAFFAAWSVLSNIFCSLLIFTTRIFRLHDYIEVLENGEKPGLKGRVIDINLIYTTLEETGNERAGTYLRVPNSLMFQRILRQWHGPAPASPVPARPFHAEQTKAKETAAS